MMTISKLPGLTSLKSEEFQSINWENSHSLIPLRKKNHPQSDPSASPSSDLINIKKDYQSKEKETVILKPINPEQKPFPFTNNYPLSVYSNLALNPVRGSMINILA